MPSEVCRNCSNTFDGNFCNNCGESRFSIHDKSLNHFFEEGLHFITHFDNKFFKTLFLIFTKPGLVSVEYTAGAKKRYFKPVSLFLFGVVLYLIFPLLQGLNVSFTNHVLQQKALGLDFISGVAETKAAALGISMGELGKRFNAISPKVSKLLLFIIVPLTGLALAALFFKSRRYFYDHFILSAEINTFFLFLTFFILPLLFILIKFVISWFGIQGVFMGDTLSLILHSTALYLACFFAFRRFYGLRILGAIVLPLVFLVLHSVIVYLLYRVILYFTVLLFL